MYFFIHITPKTYFFSYWLVKDNFDQKKKLKTLTHYKMKQISAFVLT